MANYFYSIMLLYFMSLNIQKKLWRWPEAIFKWNKIESAGVFIPSNY